MSETLETEWCAPPAPDFLCRYVAHLMVYSSTISTLTRSKAGCSAGSRDTIGEHVGSSTAEAEICELENRLRAAVAAGRGLEGEEARAWPSALAVARARPAACPRPRAMPWAMARPRARRGTRPSVRPPHR